MDSFRVLFRPFIYRLALFLITLPTCLLYVIIFRPFVFTFVSAPCLSCPEINKQNIYPRDFSTNFSIALRENVIIIFKLLCIHGFTRGGKLAQWLAVNDEARSNPKGRKMEGTGNDP